MTNRFVLLTVLILTRGPVFGSVNAVFSPDNKKAMIIVTDSNDGDYDAVQFFDALDVPAINMMDVLRKKFVVDDGAFSVSCSYRPEVIGSSCTFVVQESTASFISGSTRRVRYTAENEAAAKIYSKFFKNLNKNFKYATADFQVRIAGSEKAFSFAYRGN